MCRCASDRPLARANKAKTRGNGLTADRPDPHLSTARPFCGRRCAPNRPPGRCPPRPPPPPPPAAAAALAPPAHRLGGSRRGARGREIRGERMLLMRWDENAKLASALGKTQGGISLLRAHDHESARAGSGGVAPPPYPSPFAHPSRAPCRGGRRRGAARATTAALPHERGRPQLARGDPSQRRRFCGRSRRRESAPTHTPPSCSSPSHR